MTLYLVPYELKAADPTTDPSPCVFDVCGGGQGLECVHVVCVCVCVCCLLYTSPSPRDCIVSRMPSSA